MSTCRAFLEVDDVVNCYCNDVLVVASTKSRLFVQMASICVGVFMVLKALWHIKKADKLLLHAQSKSLSKREI